MQNERTTYELGAHLHLDEVPTLVARGFGKTTITIAELRGPQPDGRPSLPLRREDAVLLSVQLVDCARYEHWEHGRRTAVADLRAGETLFSDLRREPRMSTHSPFHMVAFHIPLAAFDALADDIGAARMRDFAIPSGAVLADAIVRNLAISVLPDLNHTHSPNRLFVDHIVLALTGHVAHLYGGLCPASRPLQRGLAAWQERRAKELLRANLDGRVGLEEVAKQCGLSLSHFSRAFRRSTGSAPHAWLVQCRLGLAKQLLRGRDLPLSEVAFACGFADQSHFTRTFTREIGVSPGAWRRCAETRANAAVPGDRYGGDSGSRRTITTVRRPNKRASSEWPPGPSTPSATALSAAAAGQ